MSPDPQKKGNPLRLSFTANRKEGKQEGGEKKSILILLIKPRGSNLLGKSSEEGEPVPTIYANSRGREGKKREKERPGPRGFLFVCLPPRARGGKGPKKKKGRGSPSPTPSFFPVPPTSRERNWEKKREVGRPLLCPYLERHGEKKL